MTPNLLAHFEFAWLASTADATALLADWWEIVNPQMLRDQRTNILLGTVLGLLILAFFIGRVLKRQPESTANPAVVRTFNLRVRAWLLMCAMLIFGFVLGYSVTLVMFGLISFWALREFITMTPTRRGDHRALFWTFMLFTPLQYVLVAQGGNFYAIYTVMIPVYASLFIPARIAFAGDPKRFLERTAKIQAGLLICVYSLSHAPAILTLRLTDSAGKPWPQAAQTASPMGETEPMPTTPAATTPKAAADERTPQQLGSNAGVLFFFILLVQLNDVFQYGWGILLGKHVIAPEINASRTWEGLIGGCLCTVLVGVILCWVTPFRWDQAAVISLIVALMGYAGGMTMSAIKRDRGVKDFGSLVQGHAGVLDRIDSLCFAAPVFFHITRFFFTA
ncbi:phosphatidate cytidylyltransferase [Anatilimnocola floriformis]|uniref:phosphatidate cytidylyltransferase n=1 Tax=Anatilimnocola floriformis TaxID=2948575 RepID=UPI0020C2CA6E|nr:phosphatidate cytidylyltransferase [Anatilimnocola floriformis]